MAPAPPPDDDSALIELIEDGDDAASPAAGDAWTVLVVDDDPDVHQATEFALKGVAIEGRRLAFAHAYSAAEARRLLAADDGIAVMLLDVVMESEDAGLQLVRHVREDLGREALRIVLRTGQPGYAPEIDTIRRFDINDYRTKSELTRVRLYTSLTGALRAYRQILAMQQVRRGLESIVAASTELVRLQGVQRFAEGAVTQLCGLLGMAPEGLVCAQNAEAAGDGPRIIAAAGRYADLIDQPLAALDRAEVRDTIALCLRSRRHVFEPALCLFFGAASGRGLAAYVDARRPLDAMDRHLLEVFCASSAVSFENVLLYSQLLDYAYYDQLLRMPNRNRFLELVDQHLRAPEGITLALIDIDDFAGINDTLGHRIGDRVLRAVADRLSLCLGPDTTLARIGSDTFGAVGPAEAVNPEVLAEAFVEPFAVEQERLRLSATSGLVRLNAASPQGAELLKDAHVALKQAKQRQRGSAHYFSESMGTDVRERMRLLRGLREAFEERRLFVFYQPQVELAGGRAVGAEALLRWRNEDGSFVPPDRFIPVAEQSGLIIAIGEFVLRTACHELHRLHELGHAGLRMSVNVSQAQFRDPGFIGMLRRALRDSRIDPTQLELEITESMAAEHLDTVMSVLAEIKRSGVTVAIDDFGTGFSSLSVLRHLDVDRLKIDRAFVAETGSAEQPASIARMVVELGRSLHLEVIAEGVETEAQRDELRALGCHEAQGYLFGRPMPAEMLERWLAERR